MHYPKLLTTKGVALERLYADRPTQEESNWRSAAESAGYGTPGYRNSQAGCTETDAEFAVEPEVFSPDNDGFEDYAEVFCRFTEEENRVNIVVYNNRGFPVKHLANNVLCGNESFFRWEGDDNKGAPAPAGMYVVQIESWNLRTGKTLRKRKVVSIYR
jgi:flagellar hook assembly protein FlgD